MFHYCVLRTDQQIFSLHFPIHFISIAIFIFIHSLIDSNRINVPEWQFVYLNDSYNFVCDSDVYNLSIDHWTDVGNDAIHPGFLNNAQLSNEGQYTCTFTILNSIDKRTMNVIVLSK